MLWTTWEECNLFLFDAFNNKLIFWRSLVDFKSDWISLIKICSATLVMVSGNRDSF